MTFRVGQKVVCVDARRAFNRPGRPAVLRLNGIYTVCAVGLTHYADPAKLPCILVLEDVGHDAPIWAHRFRPLTERKTDISIFTAMLKPEKVSS